MEYRRKLLQRDDFIINTGLSKLGNLQKRTIVFHIKINVILGDILK